MPSPAVRGIFVAEGLDRIAFTMAGRMPRCRRWRAPPSTEAILSSMHDQVAEADLNWRWSAPSFVLVSGTPDPAGRPASVFQADAGRRLAAASSELRLEPVETLAGPAQRRAGADEHRAHLEVELGGCGRRDRQSSSTRAAPAARTGETTDAPEERFAAPTSRQPLPRESTPPSMGWQRSLSIVGQNAGGRCASRCDAPRGGLGVAEPNCTWPSSKSHARSRAHAGPPPARRMARGTLCARAGCDQAVDALLAAVHGATAVAAHLRAAEVEGAAALARFRPRGLGAESTGLRREDPCLHWAATRPRRRSAPTSTRAPRTTALAGALHPRPGRGSGRRSLARSARALGHVGSQKRARVPG